MERAIDVLSSTYANLPCTVAFSHDSEQTVSEYVNCNIRNAIWSNSALMEAGDHSAVGLWHLPSDSKGVLLRKKSSVPSTGLIKKEWRAKVQKAKEKHIGIERMWPVSTISHSNFSIRPHYHFDFLARNPNMPKVHGAVSALIRTVLGLAEQDQLSVFGEAATAELVPFYEHFGFRVIEEITVGEGIVDEDGNTKIGGSRCGFKAWLILKDYSDM